MKKILSYILLVTFISNSKNVFSQKDVFLNITYVKEYRSKLDTSITKSFKNEIGALNSLLTKYSKEISYQLTIANEHSLFSINEFKMDNPNFNFKEVAGSIGGTGGKFYVNKKEGMYLNQFHFMGDDFLIKIEAKKWKITNEFKFISDFKCYKATSEDTVTNNIGVFKSKVIAWFCPDLPSFFGPAGYFGLPGLILELDNSKMKLRATKIDFSKTKNAAIKPLKKGNKLTEKEFNDLTEKKARALFPKSFKGNKN